MKKDDQTGIKHQDFAFEVKDITEKGNFVGYGSVFNNVDYGGDIVMPGAFAKHLDEIRVTKKKIPILYQHRSGEPLGVYQKIDEDKAGLLMEGKLLIDDVQRAKETYALMKAEAISGLSIGYKTVVDSYDRETDIRKLIELKLRETSIVTFPMNDLARVGLVKSAVSDILSKGQLPSLPEFENFLCEAGFSRTQAKAIAGGGLRKLSDQCEADGNAKNAGAVMDALASFKLQ